jgi:uncharacterized protein YndB with AHSA1/START domain
MNLSRYLLSVSLLSMALFGGCQAVSDSMSSHFNAAPVERTIAAPRERTFQAALEALKAMSYTVQRSRAKEGLIDATGKIATESGFRTAQQYTVHIEIEATADGQSLVRMAARELSEEQTASGTVNRSDRPIPLGAPHHRFFDELQRHL